MKPKQPVKQHMKFKVSKRTRRALWLRFFFNILFSTKPYNAGQKKTSLYMIIRSHNESNAEQYLPHLLQESWHCASLWQVQPANISVSSSHPMSDLPILRMMSSEASSVHLLFQVLSCHLVKYHTHHELCFDFFYYVFDLALFPYSCFILSISYRHWPLQCSLFSSIIPRWFIEFTFFTFWDLNYIHIRSGLCVSSILHESLTLYIYLILFFFVCVLLILCYLDMNR